MKFPPVAGVAAFFFMAVATQAAIGRERGYAVWTAKSLAAPGTEITVRVDAFVDRAFLRPAEAVRTLTPLMDLGKNRVILPAGGMLVLMSGGRAGEFCTWNHGPKLVPPEQRSRLGLTNMGGLLCFAVDADRASTNLHYVSGNNALLLREYGIDFAGGAKSVNSVRVEKIAPDLYPEDVETGPVATLSQENGKKLACLRWGAAVNGGELRVFSTNMMCFGDVGQSVGIETGLYTLVKLDVAAKSMTIRVDQPFELRDFVPRIFERYTVR